MVRLIVAGGAVILAVLAGLVGYRTFTFTAPPPPVAVTVPDLHHYQVDVSAAALRLSEAVRFRTVSLIGAVTDERDQFEQFQAWMAVRYPAFHAVAKREAIGELSLMYTWQGSDPAQPPLLLLAHQDVVPAPPDTRAQWRFDPFGGVIEDNAIWGRGSLDDKSSLIGLLEAAEIMAASGAKPKRTIIFAFGHDEELGGQDGAIAMAALLAQRGIRAWMAVDEGLAIIARHPLTGGPVSLIGISEKGFGTLRVVAHGQAGHSSLPPSDTAVSRLAEAITRVHNMPIDHSLGGGPALDMMRALSPQLALPTRMAVANEWLFAPLLKQRLSDPTARALIGTTIAPTMVQGGSRPNVLPAEATAYINLRIHPRDTTASLLARARASVAGMEQVEVDWSTPPLEASPVSSASSSSYALLAALAHALEPDTPVAPGLVLAGTDSRHYSEVAENIYRFQPILLTNEDLEGIHGVNEHLSIDNLERVIRFDLGLLEAGAMQ